MAQDLDTPPAKPPECLPQGKTNPYADMLWDSGLCVCVLASLLEYDVARLLGFMRVPVCLQ